MQYCKQPQEYNKNQMLVDYICIKENKLQDIFFINPPFSSNGLSVRAKYQ